MLRLNEIALPLEHSDGALRAAVLGRLGIPSAELVRFEVFKRGVDARKPNAILYVYAIDAEVRDEESVLRRVKNRIRVAPSPDTRYRVVATATEASALQPRPVVIGLGPAGLFAALILAQSGFRPLVLERGKAVRERTKDTFRMWREGVLDTESNTQFGEGGAGTFSDGKLYSQVKDPKHYGRKVMREFVEAGAPAEILYVSRPHIGTFRLVGMVEKMRARIIELGGEIRFGARVDDIEIEPIHPIGRRDGAGDGVPQGLSAGETHSGARTGRVRGVVLAGGERIAASHVVLAVGHSARDTFAMLNRRGVFLEAKPFSIGFRIEHPQSLINRCRYGKNAENPLLGAADYRMVHHARNGRSVYTFCMCPGGTVVAATSEEGRVVTNGMSQYSRSERNANAGIVVGITPEADYPGGPLAGIEFQRFWETRAFELGGGTYHAPGQLVGDFLARRPSTAFGAVLPSYTPGVHLCDLSTALPEYAITAIREALPAFARQLKGFDLPDAVLTAVESRTSSPLRITRDDADLQSVSTAGLYPTGEGAGYAGGILSAGIDGIRIAESVAFSLVNSSGPSRPGA
ncbi:MAG: NAD(P)/FAD-dependent oxidoreductase [Phycisphaerae bacterium]|nr:NAD(P)/FAD-dependent oxidoreductase [Phycisphaerae bacterium]